MITNDFPSDFKIGFQKEINVQDKKITDNDKSLITNILYQTNITGNYKEDHDNFFNNIVTLGKHRFSDEGYVSSKVEKIFENAYHQALPPFAQERMKLIDKHLDHLQAQKHINSKQKKLLRNIYVNSFNENDSKGFFHTQIDELVRAKKIQGPQAFNSKLEYEALTSMTFPEKIISHLDQLEKEKKITSQQRGRLLKAYSDNFSKEKKSFDESLDELKQKNVLTDEEIQEQKDNYAFLKQGLSPLVEGKTLAVKKPSAVVKIKNISITQRDYTLLELITNNQSHLERIIKDLKPSWWNFRSDALSENKAAIFERQLEIIKQQDPAGKSLHRYEFEPLGYHSLLPTITSKGAPAPKTNCVLDWNEYTTLYSDPKVNVTKIDFANKFMGGGCFSEHTGFLQEEQMMASILNISLLLAEGAKTDEKRTDNDGGIITRKGGEASGQGIGTPQLIRGNAMLAMPLPGLNLQDKKDIHLAKPKLREDLSKVSSVPVDYGILALAAPRHIREAPHDVKSAEDLFITAYTGFCGVVQLDQMEKKQTAIETGLWGAGDFGNDPGFVIAIQYLSARLAGVNSIKFFGIDPKFAQQCIDFVDQMIKDNPQANAQQFLQILVDKQDQLK